MSIAGELPRLDAAVFADTGWEPAAVYHHLDRLDQAARAAGILVYRVSAGNLRADALDPAHRFASMPLHVRHADGGRGMVRRQCTREYKLTPIRRQVRALHQAAGRPGVEQWIGISLDETVRMRTSDAAYITNRYPLVEQRMSRWDCQRWLAAHGWPNVPKSACIGCPFRTDASWRQLRDRSPTEWTDAVTFDRQIRHGHCGKTASPLRAAGAFLHRDCVPLDQADLSTPEQHGQLSLLEGFNSECEGLCGT